MQITDQQKREIVSLIERGTLAVINDMIEAPGKLQAIAEAATKGAQHIETVLRLMEPNEEIQ